MACVNAQGELSNSAKKLLHAIESDALTPQEISKQMGAPLFKVRSSLREMEDLEFVTVKDERYKISSKAKELLD
ncbi:hypothetical protein [Oceanobacillus halophilus]|uniref:Uncharacterized protein n=1 Tax=Oceanobacillus halophilus TaxID=930130 RepID=A0A495A4N4_9BACI|nr:hypothetical protein [Oceanobacillus halophilus]RKQ34602.1 hypothetical protein D8M06_06680 [Oceanobacillus halophilus]